MYHHDDLSVDLVVHRRRRLSMRALIRDLSVDGRESIQHRSSADDNSTDQQRRGQRQLCQLSMSIMMSTRLHPLLPPH